MPEHGPIRSGMCGRYTHRFTWAQLHRLLGLTSWPEEELVPRYNVAPTQLAPVVRGSGSGRVGALMKWGLIPSWADDAAIGSRMVNARAETVAEKPAFRAAFAARRCLVPVSGFYEWHATPGEKVKTPFVIQRASGEPFMLAGLWEQWSKGPAPVESFTILTTTPNALLEPIHDRMPVIVDEPDWDCWLNGKGTAEASQLLRPHGVDGFETRAISTRVNSPRNDDPSVLN